MVIREFTAADSPALWKVFYAAVHGTASADYSAEQVDAWAPAHPDLAKWAERMEKIQPFVAEVDGQIVGYADLQSTGYIDHFFVASTAARTGVGSALMRHIHQRAQKQSIGRLFSDVSITARPFYGKFGFKVEAEQQVTVRGVVLTNFKMSKQLM